MQLQDFGPAIESLKRQLEQDPENIQLLLQLTDLYLKVEGDEYYNSVLTLDKILQLDPTNFAANRIRGLIYKEHDNPEEALKCFALLLETYANLRSHPEYHEVRFDYAELLEQLDKDEEALQLFEQLYSENPKDISVLFKIAHYYTLLERYDEAVSSYKKIIDINPDNEAALSQLVELYENVDKKLYHTTKAELSIKENNFSRAIAEYRKLLPFVAEPEEECKVHIDIASSYLKLEDYERALDEYNIALDISPKNIEAYKGLGRAYYESEDFESAIESFETVLNLNDEEYDVHIDLADCYIELEKYPEAVRELESVKKHIPDDMEVRCGLAEGYITLRDLYKAKEELDFVLAREPENTRALGSLVDLYLEKEDYEAALEASKKIVKIIPNSAFSARKMAEAYHSLGDKYNASYNYALSYELQSEYGMAIDEYQGALELKPDSSELMMKIGDLYIIMGEKFIGIEYYENAAEVDETNVVPLIKLASFYQDNGDLDRATDAYSKIVALDKKNSDAIYMLAALYEKQKYNEDALETYKKFLELAPTSTKADIVKKKVEKLEKKLGRNNREDDIEDENAEYEEYVDDRTVLQRLVDLFKR